MTTKIAFAPSSVFLSRSDATRWVRVWTTMQQQCALVLYALLRFVYRERPTTNTTVTIKKKKSALKPIGKQSYRVSSMGAVAKSRMVAKRWALKKRDAVAAAPNSPASSIELWDFSSKELLWNELIWQASSLAPLSQEGLARQSSSDRDVALGDRLFRLVTILQPQQAAKITGMLLELENHELLEMIAPQDIATSAESICRWVSEAVDVLRESSRDSELEPVTPKTPKLPAPPPPSPNQSEWKVVNRRRRSRSSSRDTVSFSNEELQEKLATATSA